jgi:hypothetical protein
MGKAARRKREQRRRGEARAERTAEAIDAVQGGTKAADWLRERRQPDLGTPVGRAPLPNGKETFAYGFLRDRHGDLHMERLALPAKLFMSTPTLLNLSRLAREQRWCSKALDDETLARLDPAGEHMVLGAFKHTTQDWKRENVRAHMYLKLRGQGPDAPHERIVDLPSRQFGVFLGALRPGRAPTAGAMLLGGAEHPLRKPHWAAGRSFPKAWDECETMFTLFSAAQVSGPHLVDDLRLRGVDTPEKVAAGATSPRALMGAAALNSLAVAKLIVVEPEWVAGIDDRRPDNSAIAGFAKDCHLPFETIYLDFEGPAGNLPTVPVRLDSTTRTLKLAGALVWREVGDEGGLVVVPFAAPSSGDEGWSEPSSYAPMGRYVLHGAQPAVDVGFASTQIDGEASDVRITVVEPWVVDVDAAPGRIEVPLDGARERDLAVAWASALYAAATRSLRVLYMLQGANVQLVEAKLHSEGRRRLKRAEKRGWPIEIGLMVAVRTPKKLYYRPPGSEAMEGQGIAYSHAFWVSGHPAYYPLGTRIADSLAEADPSKLVEHPVKGLCRMVWRPPYVKGLYDPDTGVERDPVEKVRKVVGDLPPDC